MLKTESIVFCWSTV